MCGPGADLRGTSKAKAPSSHKRASIAEALMQFELVGISGYD
jgi:hypothetical protein